MLAVLRVFWQTIKHINLRGYVYVWANMVWVVLSLGIVTAPAAWAGLAYLSHRARTEPTVSLNDFWAGFRQHFWRSLPLGVGLLLLVIINVVNLLGYAGDTAPVTFVLRGVWLAAIFVWLSIWLYFWVIIHEMQTPDTVTALRNAALMILRHPFFTLGLWVGIIPLAILSTVFFPAWLLLTGSSIAALFTTAVLDRLQQ